MTSRGTFVIIAVSGAILLGIVSVTSDDHHGQDTVHCCTSCATCGKTLVCVDAMETDIREKMRSTGNYPDGMHYTEITQTPVCYECTSCQPACPGTHERTRWNGTLRYEITNGEVHDITFVRKGSSNWCANRYKFMRDQHRWTCQLTNNYNTLINEVSCRGNNSCEQMNTDCAAFQRYCLNELYTFIERVREQFQADNSFGFVDNIEITALCDGQKRATRPVIKGIAVATKLVQFDTTQSIQIDIYQHEPLSEKRWDLGVYSESGTIQVNCPELTHLTHDESPPTIDCPSQSQSGPEPNNGDCLPVKDCQQSKNCTSITGHCLNSLADFKQHIQEHLLHSNQFVFTGYLELPGKCTEDGTVAVSAMKGIAVANVPSTLESTTQKRVQLTFYPREPTEWSGQMLKFSVVLDDKNMTQTRCSDFSAGNVSPVDLNRHTTQTCTCNEDSPTENHADCLGRDTCQQPTGCDSIGDHCLNKLSAFVRNINRHIPNNTSFVLTDYLELPGICSEAGQDSIKVSAIKGIAVASVSRSSEPTPPIRHVQLEFYPHEPTDMSGQTLTFSVVFNDDGVASVTNCSESPDGTIPLLIRHPSKSTNEEAISGNPDDSGGNYPGSSIAIAVVVSFIAGVLAVIMVLVLRRHIQTRSCMGKARGEDRETVGKGTGVVTPPQVLQRNANKKGGDQLYTDLDHGKDTVDHTYDKSQLTYESIKADEARDSHVYSTAQTPYERLGKSPGAQTPAAGNEHVYDGLEGKKPPAGGAHAGKPGPRPDHLFEEGRDSSASAHNYFTLQNDNFRLSDQNASAAKQGTSDANKDGDTGNTYFVLEKEKKGNIPVSSQQDKTDNAYFVLEKDKTGGAPTQQQQNKPDNTYFVLEKEQQDNATPTRQPGDNTGITDNDTQSDAAENKTDNTYFVLEKEDKVQAPTHDDSKAPENSYFVLEKDNAADEQTEKPANATDNTYFVLEKEGTIEDQTANGQ